jgi:hypothetical protein
LQVSGTDTYSAPAITAEMSTLGGTATTPSVLKSGYVVLSWPTSYTQETIMVSPINGVVPV